MVVKSLSRFDKSAKPTKKGNEPCGIYKYCMYNETATRCSNTLTLPFTQVMTPPKTRKSKKTMTVAWKEGDTQALLGEPSHHTPKEIAAAQKEAAKEQKSKEQAGKAKAKKTA